MMMAPRISVRAWIVIGWLTAATALAQAEPTASVPCTPWPATDALGRKLPTPDEVGPPQADRFVGIFYFLWHDREQARHPLLNGPCDLTKILARDPNILGKMESPLWGAQGAIYWWGEPLYGYYNSVDPWVLRRHAQLLADAGIDTLIFDTTNAVTYPDVYRKLCEVFRQVRQEGGRTPQIAFMVNTEAGKTAQELYKDLYKPALFRDLWFQWRGKPLLICDPAEANAELKQFFTLRRAHWPMKLVNTPYAWHWEAIYPQVYGYTDDPKKPEQVNVSIAHNLSQADGTVVMMSSGNARGRSFHNGKQDTTPGAINWGYNAQEQWTRALELKPPFVMVTGWNEWIAGRWGPEDGKYLFCDQFDQEFSRDIEPMKGGHGDNYYWQLVANVRRYKGAPALPKASAPTSIRIGESFSQWRDVGPEYLDRVGETTPRDFAGAGGTHYTNRTGRNDLVAMKVARDAKNVSFYVRTRQPISKASDSIVSHIAKEPLRGEGAGARAIDNVGIKNWMWLLIDADRNSATGWEGCDFIVNRTVEDGKMWLERNRGGWQWEKVVLVDLRVEGNEMQLSIPRSALGLPQDTPSLSFDFKWADNIQSPGDPLDYYLSGDTAPEGRFMYRYLGE